jgi:hypothetical protein
MPSAPVKTSSSVPATREDITSDATEAAPTSLSDALH